MITEIEGIKVTLTDSCPNWMYSHSFPQETVASGEIRGGVHSVILRC